MLAFLRRGQIDIYRYVIYSRAWRAGMPTHQISLDALRHDKLLKFNFNKATEVDSK